MRDDRQSHVDQAAADKAFRRHSADAKCPCRKAAQAESFQVEIQQIESNCAPRNIENHVYNKL